MKAIQPSTGHYPDVPFGVFEQVMEVIAREPITAGVRVKTLAIRWLPGDKLNPVKADQVETGADPDVPIFCLRDGVEVSTEEAVSR